MPNGAPKAWVSTYSRTARTLAEEDYNQEASIKRMTFIDGLPAEVRECVHEFGLPIVQAFLDHGVGRAKTIRHLVRTILAEMRGDDPIVNFSQKSFATARAASFLAGGGYLVVPRIPTPEMVEASINALDSAGIAHTGVTRTHKHAVRLIHANVEGHIGPSVKEQPS